SDVPLFKELLKKFKAKSIKVEEKDPTKMTKEEFFAKIDNGLTEYENGKSKEFKTFKEFQNYISK
ncbi:hypothetical protein D1J35_12150, partial [Riemerella anatipestifer]|nr:hypothetical protein [Riemerella anatipestifer]